MLVLIMDLIAPNRLILQRPVGLNTVNVHRFANAGKLKWKLLTCLRSSHFYNNFFVCVFFLFNRKDTVKISMDTFVKRFQPERYQLWMKGHDMGPHPEDTVKSTRKL